MHRIKVTFSDGTEAVFHEEQTFQTWKTSNNSVSLGELSGLWYHHHDGLIPSFLEIVANAPFFFDVEKTSQQNFEYRFLDSLKILEELHFSTFVSLLSSKVRK